MILTWASAQKKGNNTQSVDTLRERPSKQSRRGVCLLFLNDCKSAKGPSRGDPIPIVRNNQTRFRPPCSHSGLGPSYQRVNPRDDATDNTATATPRNQESKKRPPSEMPNHPAYPWFKSRCLARKLKLRICTRLLRWWTRPPLRAVHLSAHKESAGVLYDGLRLHK
jgi:hypothetical protein